MKIISWNVNGLRAVYQKNFLEWLEKESPDLIGLQETKAQPSQLPFDLLNPLDYYSSFHSATKKGYSGVAVFSKQKPIGIKRKIGIKRFDQEGRFLQVKFPKLTLINLYIPHGQRDKSNLPYKLKVYKHLLNYLKKLKDQKIILTGDFNIAHKEIDLVRPKENKNNIMFTPEERSQLDQLINLGFSDTFRIFNQKKGNYSWWPYTHNARKRNLGWRLDYLFTSKKVTPQVEKAFILKEVKLSDHCPVGVQTNA